jgi:hypothetical protein
MRRPLDRHGMTSSGFLLLRSSTGSSLSALTGVRTPYHWSASGTTTRSPFCTGPDEQKARNVEANPQVAVRDRCERLGKR